jgi:hypothetical protein
MRAALQELRLSLEVEEFDPSQSSRSFAIAGINYAARAVIPALDHQAGNMAPCVVLDFQPVGELTRPQ